MAQLPPGFVLDSNGPIMGPPPKPPAPRDPLAVAIDQERLNEMREPDKPNLPAGYEMGPDGVARRIPGLPAAAVPGAKDDVKIQQKRAALTSLETQINRVDELYRKGFRDEALGIISSIGEYFPSDEASQLNAAGAGLAEQGLAAFRVPGVGSQSDTELRQFTEANRPDSWDRDAAIEEKLRQLRGRVDATRAEMGLPPAQWLASDGPADTAQSQEIDGQRVFDPQSREQTTLATGETRFESDPRLAGVNDDLNLMLKRGAKDSEIIGYLRGKGASGQALLDIKKQLIELRKWQSQHPGYAGNFTLDIERREVPVSALERAAASGPGTAIAAAGDAATGFNLDSIIGTTGGDAEEARLGLELGQEQHPGWALGGTLAGGTMAALGAEGGLARLGMGPGFARAATADTLYGAGAGAGASDDNRLAGAATGSLAGLVGSAGGQALTRGLGKAVGGVSNPSVRAVADSGTPMTVGQAVGQSGMLGRMVKGAEDRMAGFSGPGDMINARRTEGVKVMNAKTFDKALEPIGESVGNKFGEEAVEEAQGLVGGAFSKALGGKSAGLDSAFIADASAAKASIRSIPRIADEIEDSVDEVVSAYFDPASGTISGENMQALLQELGAIKRGYKGDPLGHRVSKAIGKIEASIEGLFRRQAPEAMPQYDAAKKAFRRLSIVEDAVLRAKNSSDGGQALFTPGQLGMSDRANAKEFSGGHAAAAGKGEFHDFQRPMQEVLPNKVPDSGTAGRVGMVAIPAAIGASGGTLGYAAGDAPAGAGTALGLAGLLALAYTRRGQGLLVGAAVKRGPKARAAGRKIKERSRLIGASGATMAVQGTSPDQ
jgi:hypothetical protein